MDFEQASKRDAKDKIIISLLTTGWTSGKRDKCKTWLISALLPEGIRWELLRMDVYRRENGHGVRTHNYTQIYSQVVMHRAIHRNGARRVKHAGT